MPSDYKARLDALVVLVDCCDDTEADDRTIEAISIAHALLTERNNLHAELIERCELLERMAGPGPCFLAVCFRDHPGAGAIHFATDHDLIYGPEPEGNTHRPRACLRCGWTGPAGELRSHLATCE